MTWVKIEDGFLDHPKLIDLSPEAAISFIKSICYCSKHLTDGHIPTTMAGRIATKSRRNELEKAGLWDAVDDGIMVHNYTKYQRTREQVETARLKGLERQKRYLDKLANPVTPTVTNDVIDGVNNASRREESRVEEKRRETSSSDVDDFEEFYKAAPKGVNKRRTRGFYIKALETTTPSELLTAIRRYAVEVKGRDPQYISRSDSWLEDERWEDEYPESPIDRMPRLGDVT